MVIEIETSDGCDPCQHSGEVTGDKLDADGLWFEREPCANCNGTGQAVCGAVACGRRANRAVVIRSVVRSCCDNPACAREVVNALLREWL